MAFDLQDLSDDPFCYVTTVGRRSGQPHEIELWFAVHNGVLFLLAGGGDRSDWVRNLRADPRVEVRVGDKSFPAVAEVIAQGGDSDVARKLLATKYQGWREGTPLSDWARSALLVALRPGSP
ncbi:MAG: nitroreductase family deazaflavin-dependent oxidoreductase [Actinomycetota bacterium]|nr:nitroreductase family deazaflavin-dependent oxidoreductase [Actinomycetota bacterium]